MSLASPGYGPPPGPGDLAEVFDVCVVGSGAAGSTAAWLLAGAGLRVAVIEQGAHVRPGDSYDDMLEAAEPAWVRQENDTWAKVGYPWTTCNVGGGTVFYGGVMFRGRPVDFDPETVLGRAELPLRWPWDPDELDLYYTVVEDICGIAGDASADPTLPPLRRPYPLPPVPVSAEGAILGAAAATLGWRPFPTPLAVNSRARGGQQACVRDAPCICRRCPHGAKGDAASRFLFPAVGAGARLLAGLKAVRLTGTGRNLHAVECVRMDSGERYRLRARQFLLCANAVQTAALLLRTASDEYPSGLGNGRDLVGRGLCFKLGEYLVGYRHEPSLLPPKSQLMGLGPFSTAAVADLYADQAAPGGLGGLLYEARPMRPYRIRTSEQLLRIEALVPDEPQLANRVRLGPGTDAHGVTDVLMDYTAHPRDLARLEYMLARGTDLLRAAGCELVVREPSGWALGSCHLHGTCRMGTDPATSVTGPDGLLHEADNVYVADGALLPYPSGVNPALTIQATALRVAHRLLADRFAIHRVPLLDAFLPASGAGPPGNGAGLAGARHTQPAAR